MARLETYYSQLSFSTLKCGFITDSRSQDHLPMDNSCLGTVINPHSNIERVGVSMQNPMKRVALLVRSDYITWDTGLYIKYDRNFLAFFDPLPPLTSK